MTSQSIATATYSALAHSSEARDGLPPSLLALTAMGEMNSYWQATDVRLSDDDRRMLTKPDEFTPSPAVLKAEEALSGCKNGDLMDARPLLGRIGAKIAPTLSVQQAEVWTRATLQALSDLPPDLLRKGLEAALHKPMQFPSEVEGVVRAAVGEDMAKRYRIRNRLKELERIAAAKAEAKPAEDVNTPENIAAREALIARLGRGDPDLPVSRPAGDEPSEARKRVQAYEALERNRILDAWSEKVRARQQSAA